MSKTDEAIPPPVGYIVEGDAEYFSFPRLTANGLVPVHSSAAVLNAHGNGVIRKRLEDLIVDMVKTYRPRAIIICLDARDAVREKAFADCLELKEHLQQRCDDWLDRTKAHWAITPQWIQVVLQSPIFESWLTADPSGLANVPGADAASCHHAFANVDNEIADHKDWLSRALAAPFVKSPSTAIRISSKLHPQRMSSHSRSFRKYWKDTLRAYEEWGTLNGRDIVRVPTP